MSAIWGMFSNGQKLPPELDNKMSQIYRTKCRIDRIETMQVDSCYFGCGIQYFTSESEYEILPIFDREKNISFTADCVLDNRSLLIDELGADALPVDIPPSHIGDGTLLYLAYQKWGIQCTDHIRGLFSFAVCDWEKNCFYLATDQMSARCVYYYAMPGLVLFSTLLEPLLDLCPTLTLNQNYLADFLTSPGLMPSIASTDTPWEEIHILDPGTYLEVAPDRLSVTRYWSPSQSKHACNGKSAKDYGCYFRDLYEDSVSCALRTSGETGILLSSGLDSASCGALAADLLAKDGKNLYTYTYVPHEEVKNDGSHNVYDETEDVKKIISLHPNMVPTFCDTEGQNSFDPIEKHISIMEIPYKAYGNLPSLFEIFEKAYQKGCKVVLTGQMGNSTVSYGYTEHILFDLYHRHRYTTMLQYLNAYCKKQHISRKSTFKSLWSLFAEEEALLHHPQCDYTPNNEFLAEPLKNHPILTRMRENGIPADNGELNSRETYRDILWMQPTFTYLGQFDTKVSLFFGVLLRDPTKDMRILSFCHHLPYRYFAYQGTQRWLIRGNFRDILPTDLLDDWNRYGVQNADFHKRFIRDWETIVPKLKEHLSSDLLANYVNPEAVEHFFAQSEPLLKESQKSEVIHAVFYEVLYQFLMSYRGKIR